MQDIINKMGELLKKRGFMKNENKEKVMFSFNNQKRREFMKNFKLILSIALLGSLASLNTLQAIAPVPTTNIEKRKQELRDKIKLGEQTLMASKATIEVFQKIIAQGGPLATAILPKMNAVVDALTKVQTETEKNKAELARLESVQPTDPEIERLQIRIAYNENLLKIERESLAQHQKTLAETTKERQKKRIEASIKNSKKAIKSFEKRIANFKRELKALQ